MSPQIHLAPPGAGHAVLGVPLPRLLDEAVSRYPNPRAFNQPRDGAWKALSNAEFRSAVDELGLGLREIGLASRDRVAFFMESDLHFAMADFGCLVAGLISVPLYTTFAPETLLYVVNHAEARALVVANPEMLRQVSSWIGQAPTVNLVILAEGEPAEVRLPDGVRVMTFEDLRSVGRKREGRKPDELAALREALDPQDVATFMYTSGTTGLPKGVMLTHENISSNVYAAFGGSNLLGHQEEVVLTFLPMTHIYARMLSFASIAWGHQIYYSNPDQLAEHLREVRPTAFATVPRLLEKVFDKILLGVQESGGPKRRIGTWALRLAQEYEIGRQPRPATRLQYALADRLVYAKIREKAGLTRIKALSSGGAALRPDLANAFWAMGIPVYQGYGLTETSPVITNSTPSHTRAGTVGVPVAGVEVAIADDGEILTRGPHVMKGYYKDEALTRTVIDDAGWLHTGDIGEFTPDGHLKITDRKKALFKLSTGKYVVPQPIENRLMESPLIEQAVVVGAGKKYCTTLIFPNLEAVRVLARREGLRPEVDDESLLAQGSVVTEFEKVVSEANSGRDPWNQCKRFRLIPESMSVENGFLTPTMKVKRRVVEDRFQTEIDEIYAAHVADQRTHAAVAV
jgi:long-chain acyl-CoA synthetase